MKSPTPRRLALTAAVAAGVVAAVVLGVPYAASSRLTGERIAEDMSEWSGLAVSIANQPEIRIWPDLQADLADVVLSAPDSGLAIRAERVEIELSALAALRGEVNFTKARFINPVVTLADGTEPAAARGRIAQALEAARSAVASNRMAPDRSALPADDFGVVEFANASVVATSGGAESEIASALNGKISWEKLNGRARATVGGLLRGERFSLDLSSASPLLLFGGAETPMTLSLKSGPANLSFDGTASLGDDPYATGRATFSTPSVALLSEWFGTASGASSSFGAIALEGRVRLDPTRLRMEEAAFTLGERPARGVVDLLLNRRRPKLTGSFAFDTLDMGTFVSAFTPFDPPEGDGASAIGGSMDADLASRLDMDLRVSARQASLGSIVLADVAATARIDETLAAFDISDASVFGGDIQAGLRLDRKAEGNQIEMRLLATDVSGEAFGKATGLASLTPGGSGDVSVIMKGEGESWRSMLTNASGSFSASIGPGTLPRVDIEGFIAQVKAGAPFSMQEVAAGGSTVDGLEIKGTVAGGDVRVERLELRSQAQRILLSGSMALDGRGVELSGKMETPLQMAGSGEPPPATTFRIEGPLQAPTIIPEAAPAAQ